MGKMGRRPAPAPVDKVKAAVAGLKHMILSAHQHYSPEKTPTKSRFIERGNGILKSLLVLCPESNLQNTD
jgi:hypothetical protein